MTEKVGSDVGAHAMSVASPWLSSGAWRCNAVSPVPVYTVGQSTQPYHEGFALPTLWDTSTTFKTCGWETLLHNPRQGDASGGLSHLSSCVVSARAASAWRESGSVVWSFGCVCLNKQWVGSDIYTNPPLLWLTRPTPISAIRERSWEDSRGALLPC